MPTERRQSALPCGASRPRVFLLFPMALFLAGCAMPGPDREFREEARRQPGQAAWIRKVPLVSKFRAHGDLAPLAAALRFWGRSVRPGALSEPGADPRDLLSSEEALVRAVWRQNLWAYPCSGSAKRLKEWLRGGVPVLVRLRDPAPGEEEAYDALVTGYSDLRDVVLADTGRSGRTAIPSKDFFRRWRATDHRALIISPPQYPRWELDAEERVFRARYYEAAGQAVSAVLDYESALASGWSSPPMLVSLGNLYRGLGRSADAEALYRRAIEEDPRLARAYNNLAYLLAEQNRELDEAIRLARQALVLDPANPLFMDTLGMALMGRQRYQEASDVLERAWGRSRWYPTRTQIEIGLRLARAHFHNRQEHLAAEVLREILSMDPRTPIPDELKPLAGPKR